MTDLIQKNHFRTNNQSMLFRSFLILITLLPTCRTLKGQQNFDSIQICHGQERDLRSIDIGEYDVEIRKGELFLISSKDDAIIYESDSKRFTIKNNDKGSVAKLQLTNEGVLIDASDKYFLLNSPSSIALSSEGKENAEALYSIGDFTFF